MTAPQHHAAAALFGLGIEDQLHDAAPDFMEEYERTVDRQLAEEADALDFDTATDGEFRHPCPLPDFLE